MQRFTGFRPAVSDETHNHFQKNEPDQPQYEGVIFEDGSVAMRWRTACRSTSVWADIEDMLNIHGHPEYGTFIVWHDGPPPRAYDRMMKKALGEEVYIGLRQDGMSADYARNDGTEQRGSVSNAAPNAVPGSAK